jgi:NhaP-type Na+/H+ or K+/H+ antiporter
MTDYCVLDALGGALIGLFIGVVLMVLVKFSRPDYTETDE